MTHLTQKERDRKQKKNTEYTLNTYPYVLLHIQLKEGEREKKRKR